MKILMAYRGSSANSVGPTLALEYAKKLNAEVYIITFLAFGDKDHAFATLEKGDLKSNLETIQMDYKSQGIPCQSVISEHTDPGHAIVQYAKDEKIDLIIIGIRHRSKLGKLLLGSNAQNVLLHAPCPVLAYRE